jgi:hypothetical protein
MADFTTNQNYNGLYANDTGAGINLKSSLEDFLKIEYTEGLRNEFAVMDALINSLAKDTVSGKKKYKTFALGITDNIRGIGNAGVKTDLYQIGLTDFIQAGDHVDAEFDTTKLLGVFSITDETMLKGQGDGSLFDVLSDTLNRMQIGLKHTMNRYTYGASTGKIGVVSTVADFSDASNANPGVQTGNRQITSDIVEVKCTNSMSLLPGMGIMLKVPVLSSTTGTSSDPDMRSNYVFGTAKYRQGKIWQKDDSTTYGQETLIVVLDTAGDGDATTQEIEACNNGLTGLAAVGSTATSKQYIEVYSRQLIQGTVAPEYHGLEDIVITQNNTIFGVNRNVYRSLNCLKRDLNNALLTESELRDMADRVTLVTPEGANINLVCARHGIVSSIEKQMYQFKQYSMDTAGNGFTLGRPNVKFDTYELKKDKYARDNNVYMLDTTKVGELLRKDFGWITSGRETILERRDGTEVYEAIMTKYADMFIDAWKAHASFVNVSDTVSGDLYARSISVSGTVTTEEAGA